MWSVKAAIEQLKLKIEKTVNQFSEQNLNKIEYQDAEALNSYIHGEVNHSDGLQAVLYTHLQATHAASFVQVVAMIIMAEENSGKFLLIVFIKSCIARDSFQIFRPTSLSMSEQCWARVTKLSPPKYPKCWNKFATLYNQLDF